MQRNTSVCRTSNVPGASKGLLGHPSHSVYGSSFAVVFFVVIFSSTERTFPVAYFLLATGPCPHWGFGDVVDMGAELENLSL